MFFVNNFWSQKSAYFVGNPVDSDGFIVFFDFDGIFLRKLADKNDDTACLSFCFDVENREIG